MSSVGLKRGAASPLAGEEPQSKKQKTDVENALEQANAVIDQDPLDDSMSELSSEDENMPTPKAAPKKPKGRQSDTKKLFTPFEPEVQLPPMDDPTWGIIPYPAGEPQSHPNSPPARSSNAATSVPLWEDRKYKFKAGQFHKYFGNTPQNKDGPDRDQNDNLMIKLMDMRPISKRNQDPRRTPTVYMFEHGKPKDWNNARTIKLLNDRRRDAINRITCDAPFTVTEREYLVQLLKDYPNASITELTERLNYRFKDNFVEKVGFEFDELHSGRTVESVRYEYLTWKSEYDQGVVPMPKRAPGDVTMKQKKINKIAEARLEKFGPKVKEEKVVATNEDDAPKKPKKEPKAPKAPKKPKAPKAPKVPKPKGEAKAKVTKTTKVTKKITKKTKAVLSEKLVIDSDDEANSATPTTLTIEEAHNLPIDGYYNFSDVDSSVPLAETEQKAAIETLDDAIESSTPVTRSRTSSRAESVRKSSIGSQKAASRKSSSASTTSTVIEAEQHVAVETLEDTTTIPSPMTRSRTSSRKFSIASKSSHSIEAEKDFVVETLDDKTLPSPPFTSQPASPRISITNTSSVDIIIETPVFGNSPRVSTTENATEPPIRESSPPVQIPGLTLSRFAQMNERVSEEVEVAEELTSEVTEVKDELVTETETLVQHSRVRQLSSEAKRRSDNVEDEFPRSGGEEETESVIDALFEDLAGME